MVRVDLRVLLDVVRIELVVGHGVVPFGHPDGRVRPPAQLTGELHTADAGHIGLERQHQEVEEQFGVLVVLVRDAARLCQLG